MRVRIAPSPTGLLHIGTARTALFNWLLARHEGGSFILRIEDTDRERSTKEFEKNIIDGLTWLGLGHDEGPYRQSERTDAYEAHLKKLLEADKAYYCFCTKEVLDEERKKQEASGLAPKYSGRCSTRVASEGAPRVKAGEAAVIRLRVSPDKVTFTDLIRGEVSFDNSLSGDIVIAKNLREPLYNFAVVVDDYEMKITHVIRGEDHVANTPKQMAIADALHVPRVIYAHLPLILNPDRSKMSKRFNATSVDYYRALGYLPAAMVNFLALLGWHPSHDREVLTVDEIVKEFDISRVQKGGAIFNQEKLDFFNQQYIKQLSVSQLVSELVSGGFAEGWSSEQIERAIPLVRERMVKLSEFKDLAGFVLELSDYDPKILAWKKSDALHALANLEKVAQLLRSIDSFTKEILESHIMALAGELGKGDLLWPLRVAVSGKEQSPPPIDSIVALGKEETLKRIELAIKKLQS